jgi:UDP-GlcNAc:undecaprenyl-phosphate GlcNAc-1-phosphate transferase
MTEPSGLGLLATYPGAWRIFLELFLATNLFTGLLYFAAKKWKIMMPKVRKRDVHDKPKPRIGGLSMWIVSLLALIIILTGSRSGLLSFDPGVLKGIFGGLIAVLVFGLIDDMFSLGASWQFLGQLVAAGSLVMGGLKIEYLRIPLAGQIALSPVWSALFIVAWVVVIINAINLFDGLDCLAGSMSLTASVFLLLVSLKLGFVGAATLALILMGITAGFLPWNWHPSKLFMGTVGSQTLGFLLGSIAVISGAKVATAVLVLGIPLFDAVSVIIRRLLAHESPFKADQRHLHHRLLRLGLTPPQVVWVTNGMAFLFGIFALSTQQASEKAVLIGLLVLSMFAFIWLTHFLERRLVR